MSRTLWLWPAVALAMGSSVNEAQALSCVSDPAEGLDLALSVVRIDGELITDAVPWDLPTQVIARWDGVELIVDERTRVFVPEQP